MYRVLIIDDEPIIRRGLTTVIDWAALNCQIVSEASDGLEALEKLAEVRPDIVITDIRMPGADGLELSRHIFENHRFTKVIILTGYPDFEYAQKALRYNVVDFILKPTSTEKVMAAVHKATAMLSADLDRENRMKALESRMESSRSEIQEKCLREIFEGILTDASEIRSQTDRLGISLHNFCVVRFELDDAIHDGHVAEPPGAVRDPRRVRQTLAAPFQGTANTLISLSNNRFCLLLDFLDENPAVNLEVVLNGCDEAIRMMESFFSCFVLAGISRFCQDPAHVFDAYQEAGQALKNVFYGDIHTAVYHPTGTRESRTDPTMIRQNTDGILESLRSGEEEVARRHLHTLFEQLKKEKAPIAEVKEIAVHIASLCSRLLSNYGLNLSEMPESSDQIYLNLMESRSVKALLHQLESIFITVCGQLNRRERQTHFIISRVREYMHQHYTEKMHLEDIARHVHVSNAYLSRLFRRETGETITDAITALRIEKAREMLLNSNLKTYEIALAVGIDDPAYFSQLFRKWVGQNPKEFRGLNRKE